LIGIEKRAPHGGSGAHALPIASGMSRAIERVAASYGDGRCANHGARAQAVAGLASSTL